MNLPKAKLYISSVKNTKNFPSLPSYLSQRGHLCFRVDVTWRTTKVRINETKFGNKTNIANPTMMDMNYGFKITSVLTFCRQKGHFIWIGLSFRKWVTCLWTRYRVIIFVKEFIVDVGIKYHYLIMSWVSCLSFLSFS